jgi:hypothetical protein
MCQCFCCANGKVTTPPKIKSFEEFASLTTVICKLGKKTGCNCCAFRDKTAQTKKKEKNVCF